MGAPKNEVNKHALEIDEVRLFVQKELIRHGRLEGPPRTGWRYVDAVATPTAQGIQTEATFVGRTGIVLYAGFVVDESYAYASRSLGQLVERMREFREAGARLLAHTDAQGGPIIAEISNGDLARRAGLSFGSQRGAEGAFDFNALNDALRGAHACVVGVDAVLASIRARQPEPVAVGFYGPKGAGPLAHFIALLDRDGLGTEAIAEVLERMPQERAGLDRPRWLEKRKVALDNVRHAIRRSTKALEIAEGSDGTRSHAEVVPPGGRVCVLLSKLDDCGRPTVVVIGGSGLVPSTSGVSAALDSDGTPGEPPARP